MLNQPLLIATQPVYLRKILKWSNVSFETQGLITKINGFDQYNRLLDINCVFSTRPFGDVVDRTQTVQSPLKFYVNRPWAIPKSCLTLDKVMQTRVGYYQSLNQKINLCWSGGIDSTAMLIGFLKYFQGIDQLRIIYSPYSVYENREFFNLLQKQYPSLELVDISGDVYINAQFDGYFVNGHGGDEFTSSLDDSFYNSTGPEVLQSSWKDYFYSRTNNADLIEFSEEYFSHSGLDIKSLLHARWWYYASSKTQNLAAADYDFIINRADSTPDMVSAFFDCDEFESYMYYHLDQIIDFDLGYLGYKQFLKEYIYEFDQNKLYYETVGKTNSKQFGFYIEKKTILLDQRWIFKLQDGSVVRTKNLPFLSQLELEKLYGDRLNYLFNCLHV